MPTGPRTSGRYTTSSISRSIESYLCGSPIYLKRRRTAQDLFRSTSTQFCPPSPLHCRCCAFWPRWCHCSPPCSRRGCPICTLLSLSAFSFFWFGYHVHEKALLLMAIPLLCQAFTDPKFIRLAVMFSVITATSLFPLLFTVFEIQIKYCIALTYILLLLLLIRHAFHIDVHSVVSLPSLLYICGLLGCEFTPHSCIRFYSGQSWRSYR